MSDLEGMDAFNRLLEELLDATRNNAGLRAERDLANENARQSFETATIVRRQMQAHESKVAAEAAKLKELHEAAAAIPDLTGSESSVLNQSHPAITRLKEALAAAADICGVDDLPF